MVGYETSIWLPLAWKYLTPILTMVSETCYSLDCQMCQAQCTFSFTYYIQLQAWCFLTGYTPLINNQLRATNIQQEIPVSTLGAGIRVVSCSQLDGHGSWNLHL